MNLKKITLTDKYLKDPRIKKESLEYFNERLLRDNIPRAPVVPIETACIKWTGGKKNSYGWFYLTRQEFGIAFAKAAHAVSYMLFKGEVGNNMVLHLCQEDLCVNPEHLIIGNAKLNATYALMNRVTTDPLNKSWKLTTSEVKKIRTLYFRYQYPQSILAKMFDVTVTTINNIISYKTWKI